MPTMYNRNNGGFDYVRIHSELLKSVFNPPAGASVHACVYTSTSKDARASDGKKTIGNNLIAMRFWCIFESK